MAREDDWVQLAMENDAVVVELLIQIHQAAASRIKSSTLEESSSLPLEWTVRQPRSKPLSVNNNNNNNNNSNKKLTTSSPTTPLSWSGATATMTSFSGGGSADGIEELSSRPQPHPLDASGSKVSGGTRTGTGTGTTLASSSKCKRPRKKKSLNELKEEENLLNKERRHLKKELAALRMDIEKQRGINENLKRLKVEKQSTVETKTRAATIPTSFSQNEMGSQKINNCFPFLPDLNIACGDHENL